MKFKFVTMRRSVEAVFLLLIFSLAFMRPSLNFRGLDLNVTDAICLLVFGCWFVALLFGRAAFRWNDIFFLFILYAVGLSAGAAFSTEPRTSFLKLAGEFYLIALAVITVQIVENKDVLKRVVFVWLAASSVAAAVGVLAVVLFYLGQDDVVTRFATTGFGSLPPGNYPRIQSTFLYPSMLCNYMTVGLMMLLAAWHSGWIRTSVFLFLMTMIAVTIAFTLTPGIGGVLLGVGLWNWLDWKLEQRPIAARVALVGGTLSAAFFFAVSTFTIFASPTSPFHYVVIGLRIDPTQRLLTWLNAAQTFAAHPIVGIGLGLPVAEVYFMPPSGQIQLLTDAHNFVLNVAAQAGLAGVVPLLSICFAVVRRFRTFCDRTEGLYICRALSIAFLSAFLYQGLVGSFEDSRHLWVLIGLIVAIGPKHSSEVRVPTSESTVFKAR